MEVSRFFVSKPESSAPIRMECVTRVADEEYQPFWHRKLSGPCMGELWYRSFAKIDSAAMHESRNEARPRAAWKLILPPASTEMRPVGRVVYSPWLPQGNADFQQATAQPRRPAWEFRRRDHHVVGRIAITARNMLGAWISDETRHQLQLPRMHQRCDARIR